MEGQLYIFGDTKIFMREEAVSTLEKKRTEIVAYFMSIFNIS
jgi:hypothetical protein